MRHLGKSSADPIQSIERPVVMLSKEYTAGYRTDLHAHPRAQFLYAPSGTMKARTNLGAWIVPPGYALLIPNGIAHQVEMLGAVVLRSAYLQPETLPDRCLETCSVIRVAALLSACIDRFAVIPAEYGKDDIGAHLAAIIIHEIATTKPSAMALPLPVDAKVSVATEVLLQDPADDRSIDQWSEQIGMSRRSFTRAFRAETGISFDQWRQRLRFQAASELIASGLPLSKVSALVGYRSVAALQTMMARFS